MFIEEKTPSTDYCGSVPQSRGMPVWFSWSGIMPVLRVQSPVWAHAETAIPDWCFSHASMFLSLSFFHPSPSLKNFFLTPNIYWAPTICQAFYQALQIYWWMKHSHLPTFVVNNLWIAWRLYQVPFTPIFPYQWMYHSLNINSVCPNY